MRKMKSDERYPARRLREACSSVVGRRVVVGAYFVLAAIFLLGLSRRGLSYLDAGMYMSGYQYFNEDPLATSFLGQWLMSYELTGALMKWLSIDTYYGLRVLRMALVMLIEVCVYLGLRRDVPRRYLLAGLALATLSQQDSYYEINYNDYSAFLLCLALLALYHAFTRSRRRLLGYALSGLAVGVAILFRFTNLSFLFLPVGALLVFGVLRLPRPRAAGLWAFYVGAAAGLALMVALAVATGKGGVLAQTVTDLFQIGTRGDDPHNVKNVFFWLYGMYKQQVKAGAIVAILVLVYAALRRRTSSHVWRVALLACFIFLMWLNIYLREIISDVTVGLSWITFFVLVVAPRFRRGSVAAFAMGFLFPLFLPIGTNGGSVFIGQCAVFMPLPATLCILAANFKQSSMPADIHRLPAFVLGAIVLPFLWATVKRPMSEEGCRLECRYAIDSPLAKGITTTRNNAGTLNHIVHQLRGSYLHGDYLICTFNIPAISLLECRPYGVFSTVFCSPYMCRHYVTVAEQHLHTLPSVLLDKEAMTPKDGDLVCFLRSQSTYRRVWTDGRFVLLKPDVRHASTSHHNEYSSPSSTQP